MTHLLGLLVSNVCMAALLALVAVVVGQVARRPALTHALWMLVLLKLITPPLVPFAIGWAEVEAATAPAPPMVEIPAPPPTSDEEVGQAPLPMIPEIAMEEEPLVPQPEKVVLEEEPEETPPVVAQEPLAEPEPPFAPPVAKAAAPAALPPAAVAAEVRGEPFPWRPVLGWAWIMGSALWLSVASRRLWQFQQHLRFAQAAPTEIQAVSRQLAERLGVRCPDIWLLPGNVAPMLWALGRSRRLLLPADLLGRLTAEQRATLIAHELAHLRRGDHWVRWLELIVLALYWWCPLVWWARHELREAEEDCCDAWVVWALPGAGKAYALALVETVDFLSEAPPAEPLLASGLGQVRHLRRRLTMIMRGTTPRALTLAGGLAVLGAAVLLLPLWPTWGQPPKDKEGFKKDFKKEFKKEFREFKERREKERPEAQRIEEELHRLKMELDKHREMAERRAHELRAELERLHHGEKEKEPGFRRPPFGPPGGPEGRLMEIEKKLDAVLHELHELRKELQQRPRFGGPGFGPGGGFFPPRGDKGPDRKGPPGFERKGPREGDKGRDADKGPERKGDKGREGDRAPDRKGDKGREGDRAPDRKGPPREREIDRKGPPREREGDRKDPPRPEEVVIE